MTKPLRQPEKESIMPNTESDQYDYVKATIHGGCDLEWTYMITGGHTQGRMNYDIPVDGYTDQEIIDETVSNLDVGNPECIEVIWD